jgi:hypothetical protein
MTDEPHNIRQLRQGDAVEIRSFIWTEGIGVEDVWIPATVHSSSDDGLGVVYASGIREMISWTSGRIKGPAK